MNVLGTIRRKTGLEESYVIFFLGSLCYAFSIKEILRLYADPNWPTFSFPYDPPSLTGYMFVAAALAVLSAVVPKSLDRPSSLIVSFVYLFVIVPINAVGICMEKFGDQSYYPLMVFADLCFLMLCLANKAFPVPENNSRITRREIPVFSVMLVSGFIILALYLFYRFGDVMQLVGLDSLYGQRALGKATNLFDGYAQTYSQYVFSTGLVAFGLFRRQRLLVLIGMGGALLNYSITAEKAGILFPFFICGLYFMLSAKNQIYRSTSIFLFAFTIANILSSRFYAMSSVFEIVAINFGTRATLVPGSFTFHYYDFFLSRGFTEYAHIRGISSFVAPPDSFAGDPRWPALGLILGEDYIGYEDLNANAHFIAYDGIASYGTAGIVLPFIVLFAIIKLFDYVSQGIPLRLSLPVLTPIALTLSNSSVFSILTSFGGFFWMAVFSWMFVATATAPKRQTAPYVERFQ